MPPREVDSAASRCPFCAEEGEKSVVRPPSMVMTTAMFTDSYYDEDGHFHHHDPNSSTGEWSCSRGHRWVESSYEKCPACDYQRGERTVRLTETAELTKDRDAAWVAR